jgi:hypothetical protein
MQEGSIVRVYRNLHKKCFSVKCMKIKRVIAHVDDITLIDATFPVSKAGRERVLRDKQKNVHAFVQGKISYGTKLDDGRRICYNPYKMDHFFYCDSGHEITQASIVRINLESVRVLE